MPQKKKEDNIRGEPGYRTGYFRSGMDPLDTSAETGRLEGKFYRQIFTLKARTRNSLYLGLMFAFGVIPLPISVYLLVNEISKFNSTTPYSYFFISFMMAFMISVMVALTINFVLSILEIVGIIHPRKVHSRSDHKKINLPKRRKDYR